MFDLTRVIVLITSDSDSGCAVAIRYISYGTKHLHYEVAGGYCHRADGYRYGERSVTVVHTIFGIHTDAPILVHVYSYTRYRYSYSYTMVETGTRDVYTCSVHVY